MHKFSEKQLEVARLIARGLTYAEMARELRISESAVKQRTDRLRFVLGVKRKRQIPQVMRDLGLID